MSGQDAVRPGSRIRTFQRPRHSYTQADVLDCIATGPGAHKPGGGVPHPEISRFRELQVIGPTASILIGYPTLCIQCFSHLPPNEEKDHLEANNVTTQPRMGHICMNQNTDYYALNQALGTKPGVPACELTA